jgi:hypothetical protein
VKIRGPTTQPSLIAFRSATELTPCAGVHRGTQGVVGFVEEEFFGVGVFGMLGHEMSVHVHETGEHGEMSQIDQAITVTGRHKPGDDFSNAASFDFNGDVGLRLGTDAVDEPRCVDQNRTGRFAHNHQTAHNRHQQTQEHRTEVLPHGSDPSRKPESEWPAAYH